MGQMNNGGAGAPWGQPQQMQPPQQPHMMPQRPMPAMQQPMPMRQPPQGGGGYRTAPMGAPQQQTRPSQMDQQNLQRRTQGAGMGTPQPMQQGPMAPQGGMRGRGFGGG